MDLGALAAPTEAMSTLWRFRRVELRTPVSADAWPLARVELVHRDRGVVTDIASAPGAINAAFMAAGHILGIEPKLTRYAAQSGSPDASGMLAIDVELELSLDGMAASGRATGVDVIDSSLSAWLEAAQALPGYAQRAGTNARSP